MSFSKKMGAEAVEYVENNFAMESPKIETGLVTFEGMTEEAVKVMEKKLIRKVDLYFIASLFDLFIFNILDRANIASARLGGIQEDLDLSDTQYQTAVSILFIGYFLGQIPSNIVLTRVKSSIYLPIAILVWGGISLCTAATHNFISIILVRFFLGFAESSFFAGALLLISSWYKPSEIAPRVAIMYCGNTVANGFGGMLAAGVLSGLDGSAGIAGWRRLYIIEGAGTMFIGILAFFLLPNFPRSGPKRWLTEQEQHYAEFRLAPTVNNEVDEVGGIKAGLKDAVSDVKVWALVFIQICILSLQTWTYFFPTIVNTLWHGKIESLLLTALVYIFGFVTSLSNALIA
ncbi:hypothetical protein MMC34_006644 [Xylographa carneopallida]|nr:hypothetical protein [Xylographa carneopallida]